MRPVAIGVGNSDRYRLADDRNALRGCFRTLRFEDEANAAPYFAQVRCKAPVAAGHPTTKSSSNPTLGPSFQLDKIFARSTVGLTPCT